MTWGKLPIGRLVLVSAVAFLSYRLFNFYPILILTTPIPDAHFSLTDQPGTCHKIRDPSGRLSHCEDLTEWVDAEGEMVGVLASCDPNRRNWNTVMGPLRDPRSRGDLWFISPRTDEPLRIPFVGYPDTHDFHPLGIAVVPSAAGTPTTLFAVNHGRHNSTVEVFTLSPPTAPAGPELTHVRTLTHPALVSPNAVVPLSPTTLLITQDHTFTRRLPRPFSAVLPMLESILALPGGSVDVLQFSADPADNAPPTITNAVAHVPFANGLALCPATGTLAVASSSLASVSFYHFPASSALLPLPLKKKFTVPLPFAPDNISFSPSGTLYAAGHPNFPALIAHAKSPAVRAASWVAAVSPEGEVRTVYQSKGGEGEDAIGASTTAVADEQRGRVWIAGLYAEGILSCAA